MGSTQSHRFVIVLVVTALVLGSLTAVAPAAAQVRSPPVVVGAAIRGEAPDYATQTFGDPWDYTNPMDLHTDDGPVINARQIGLLDGRLEVTFDGTGHFHQVWAGWPGGLRIGRDGTANPIDPARYRHLSFRAHSPLATVGAITYQTCPDVDTGCTGTARFTFPSAGWHTITVDLAQGQGQPWAGDIHAIAVTIGGSDTRTFSFDWMRLHEAGETADIAFTNPGFTGSATLHYDTDDDPHNNTPDNPGWGVVDTTEGVAGTARFDVAAHPPGAYRFFVTQGPQRTPYSDPLIIEGTPRIVIEDPDVTGGEDYATAVLGNPWDFSDAGDVAEMDNVVNASFADGWLHGTNGGADPGNPYIVLRDDGDLRTDRYHRFTITTSYDGPFSLATTTGGGMHGRVSWLQDGQSGLQQTAEVVTYGDRSTFTVPLLEDAASLMEVDLGPQPGWSTTGPSRGLRWDVNEDLGPRRWRIDEIRLAADDEAFGSFDVTWHDTAHQPGTTVAFHADRDRTGFDGVRIATGVIQEEGTNTVTVDTTSLAPGEYWIWAEATSPAAVATTRSYATGPLQVREPTAAHLTEPAGLRLAGPGRVETAVALARAAHPDGARTALLATAEDFPDALAAAPLAAALEAPVLLTGRDVLHPVTSAELARLDVDTVILLGGVAALSPDVAGAVRTLGLRVERLEGPERTATAAAVARRAVAEWRDTGVRVGAPLIAYGTQFTDALAAASLSGHDRRPLLLTHPQGLPAPTAQAIVDLDAAAVTLVGDAALDHREGSPLDALVNTVEHLAGSDHIATAALVASDAVAIGADRDLVIVASGDDFPDALAAGPAATAMGGVLLLTPRGHAAEATRGFLADSTAPTLKIAGGTAAIAPSVVAALAEAAGR